MIRTLPMAATTALALALAACGSSEEATDNAMDYDAEARSLEEVASDSEMEALEAQEEALEEEAAPAPPAIDESAVTGDNAETEEIVGM